MTPSQEYTERYKEIVREADTLGRLIGVGRLRVSQQLKVAEMTPNLDGDTQVQGPEGATISMSRRALPLLAAAVREIDGNPIGFPRSRGELDSIIDRLDEPGFSAIIKAMIKLNGQATDGDPVEPV